MFSIYTKLCVPVLFGALLVNPAMLRNAIAQESQLRNQARSQYGEKKRGQEQSRMPQDERRRVDQDRMNITDEAVEGWLVIKLAARPGLNEINVEVKDGIAALTGKVSTQEDKRRAVRIANSTMGVNSVRDQLSIDASLARREAPKISDRELAKQVAQKIAANIKNAKAGEDWWFDGWRVEGDSNRWNLVVDVTDRHVILEGEVPSVNIMRKAVEAAADVPGVRTVDSDLELPGFYRPWGYQPYAHYPAYGPYYNGYYHPHAVPSYTDDPYSGAERSAQRQEDHWQTRR